MKIRINGIFNKYNNVINIDRNCNILIGENGIGKSTTMKILKSILKKDFISLLEYHFNSIEIIDKKTILIKYEDLFISYDRFESIISKYQNDKNIKYKEELLHNIKYIYELFKNDNNNNLYKELVRETIKNKDNSLFDSNKFRKKFMSILGESEFININNEYRNNVDLNINPLPDKDIIELASSMIYIIYHYFLPKNNNDIIYFYETNIVKEINNIDKVLKEFKDILFVSSVKEINVHNYIGDNWSYSKLELYKNLDVYNKIINRIYNESKKPHKGKKLSFSQKIDNLLFDVENEKNRDKTYFEKYISYYDHIEILKELFDTYDIDYIIGNIIYENITDDNNILIDDKNLYINKLLFNSYYGNNFIKSFTKKYYIMLKKMINKEYEENELNIKLYSDDPDLKFKVETYICPLIPCNSLYKKYLNTSYLSDYEIKVFNKFVYEVMEEVINYKNDESKVLDDIFHEYFKNKYVSTSPKGLIISSINDNNDLEIEYLSEGEKRIIIMFIISILTDLDVFLLDEPETSLSVIWQKNLVPSLLKYGNNKKLIIATQSPFIVSDDDLLEYTICLPGDINNE